MWRVQGTSEIRNDGVHAVRRMRILCSNAEIAYLWNYFIRVGIRILAF